MLSSKRGVRMDEMVPQLEELLKLSRRARREDVALGEAMQRLVQNADFQTYLEKVIGSRVQSFGDTLMEPSGSQDGLVRMEYIKGTLCGLCLARDLPRVIIASMSDVHSA